ncbi:hypothetical protein GWI34_05555 [Actinomadura sp. DSM 109109]|nr:hypothetical protein [Actinomadura lepetitiana]
MARRQRFLLALTCGTTIVSTAGMIASFSLKSPAEVAAEAEPPRASVLTAPVKRDILRRTVIFRGSFASARTLTFTPPSVRDPSGWAGQGGGDVVITKLFLRVGQQVRPGKVVAEVSYRPVLALHGAVPAIRDLTQGSSGPDVAQLQRSLAELGYGSGTDVSGKFGTGTARAITRLYSAIGYPVPVTTSAEPGGPKVKGLTSPGGRATATSRRVAKPTKLVQLPKSEVMYIPSFPAQITKLGGGLGGKVSGDLLKVTLGSLKLTGRLDPASEDAVKPGQDAKVLLEDTGRQYTATVSKVGDLVKPKQGGSGDTGPYIPVTLNAPRPWNVGLEGQDARITVAEAATEGAVLAVPIGAITAPADGQTSVTVVQAGEVRRRVRVIAGMSADGYVEIRPVGGDLREGDTVVVGR